jgi:hypothetical protein
MAEATLLNQATASAHFDHAEQWHYCMRLGMRAAVLRIDLSVSDTALACENDLNFWIDFEIKKSQQLKEHNPMKLRIMTSILSATCILASTASYSLEPTLNTNPGKHALHVEFTLTGTLTPTSDPCIAQLKEVGTAHSEQLGSMPWSNQAVDYFCTRGKDSQGNILADDLAWFTFNAGSADQIFGYYHSPFVFTPSKTVPNDGSITWTGEWMITGGTGKYAGIHGHGTIPKGELPSVFQAGTVPYRCEFTGEYEL